MTITTAKLARAVALAYARPLALPLALGALMLAPAARADAVPPEAAPAEAMPAKWTPNQALSVPEAAPRAAPPPPTLARWFTPTFEVRQSFSDNVALRPEGTERSSLITELVPGLRVRHKGPRLVLNGQTEFRYYKMSQDIPGTRNSSRLLRADGKAELVEDLLYMDGNAGIQNQAISAFARQPDGNDYATANSTEVRSWRLSPYLVHRFGSFATGELRYTRDAVDAGRSGLGNSDGSTYSLRLNSGRRYRDLGWALAVSQQDIDDEVRNDSTIKTANLNLTYKLSRTLNLLGGVGYDDYDYQSLGGANSGKSWNAGFGWSPGARTSLQLTTGRRYYGPSRTLTATHRSRHTVWSLKYDDTVSTTRANFLIPTAVDTAALLDGLFLPNFPDPEERARAVEAYIRLNGLPPSLTDSINYFSNRYMLQKQLRATMAWRGPKTGAVVSVFRLQRDALSVRETDSVLLGNSLNTLNDNVRQHGVETAMTYRLGPRSNLSLIVNTTQNESLTTGFQYRNNVLRYTLRHQLGPRTAATFEMRHLKGNTGSQVASPYIENAIAASLSMQL
jgi:uncharacterized protein (PEP-CTERM system associated)